MPYYLWNRLAHLTNSVALPTSSPEKDLLKEIKLTEPFIDKMVRRFQSGLWNLKKR
jgi:hypothetical protein